jgi:hypothetical protein
MFTVWLVKWAGCGYVYCTGMSAGRDKWRAVVYTVMNYRVP